MKYGDLISRNTAIVQLSHNKTGDDDCDVIIQKDIETIKALPSVENKGEWIPVTERLPEYGEEVLTYHEDDEECQINWVIDDETGEWFHGKPIAWQPLPEPYQKGGE